MAMGVALSFLSPRFHEINEDMSGETFGLSLVRQIQWEKCAIRPILIRHSSCIFYVEILGFDGSKKTIQWFLSKTETVDHVVDKCPLLERLDVSFCQGVSYSIVQYSTRIVLNINGCWERFRPSPGLPPLKIVEIQLRAFKAWGTNTMAMGVARSFLSPRFHLINEGMSDEAFGSSLVRQVQWEKCAIRPLIMRPNSCIFCVEIIDFDGTKKTIQWFLSKTPRETQLQSDVWMTDAIDLI
eukprot:CAMPEP_0113952394 /NCGR_PEP_ID=MMETSP1339-20121228/90395_1 /TAXON_ID=94617 /ORGANISM="Fibrocapsa japonica" /LENGTH=239 /DNA_ID=CAMNT_0000961003 /DNA_START=548 /DNA_END=1267 /DNA_ORIENTATION=- /assembly_acc=CAM_ASM_000762